MNQFNRLFNRTQIPVNKIDQDNMTINTTESN